MKKLNCCCFLNYTIYFHFSRKKILQRENDTKLNKLVTPDAFLLCICEMLFYIGSHDVMAKTLCALLTSNAIVESLTRSK